MSMVNPATIAGKVRVGWSLMRKGQFSSLLRAATSKVVRIEEHRIDRIDLSTYRLNVRPEDPNKWLRCEMATEAQMKRLFTDWRDSAEEFHRHYRVYFDLGFRRCFLFIDDSTNKVAHFQFLLDYSDGER